jgi:hypothetical protein
VLFVLAPRIFFTNNGLIDLNGPRWRSWIFGIPVALFRLQPMSVSTY